MIEVLSLGPARAPLGCLRARLRARLDGGFRCLMLRCQVLVAAERRSYTGAEQAALADLFGAPEQWARSLRPLLWHQTSLSMGEAEIDLDLPVTWEENQACAHYFETIRSGTVPITFAFGGSIFYPGEDASLQVRPVPSEWTASWQLDVESCRRAREECFSGRQPVLLSRALCRRLHDFGKSRGKLDLEGTLELLLKGT